MFKLYAVMIWFMYLLGKNAPNLVNSHIHHLIYLSFLIFVRMLKFHFLSKRQLYNRVFATIATMLCVRYSDLTHFTAESVYPFPNLSSFSSPASL